LSKKIVQALIFALIAGEGRRQLMLEYLVFAFLVFVPVAGLGFYILTKKGIKRETIWIGILTALVLLVFFPPLTAWLGMWGAAGFVLLIMVGAGVLISRWWVRTEPGDLVETALVVDEEPPADDAAVISGEEASAAAAADEAAEIEDTDDVRLGAETEEPAEEVSKAEEAAGLAADEDIISDELVVETALVVDEEPPADDAAVISGEEASAADEAAEIEDTDDVRLGAETEEPTEEVLKAEEAAGLAADEDIISDEPVVETALVVDEEPPADDAAVISGEEASAAAAADDINILIERGFAAKFGENYEEAARQFSQVWQRIDTPGFFFMVGMELVSLYSRLGSYDKALEVLDRLGGDSRLSPTEVDKVARERELLQITQRLLQEIGMPDLPAANVPRLIRLKAGQELEEHRNN
jgi:tetratricopeptide (TPR) repeat protein